MPNETDIDPNDPEPFIRLEDFLEAQTLFVNEIERIASQERVPRGWSGELSGGISSVNDLKIGDGATEIESYVTAFAPDKTGKDYAETQHEDERYHFGEPPFSAGFSDIAPPGKYESDEDRYWAGFSFALSNGYARRFQNPYLVDAADEAFKRGYFDIFFGDIGATK